MEDQSYITLTRQTGLLREMQVVANNIANAATTGYRQEGVVFSEYVRSVDNAASVSMGQGNVGTTSIEQGALRETGGRFDFAIEGDGFFLIETPDGVRLTRSGAFSPSANGDLVNMDGYPVLDAGGAPVFVPGDAVDISVGPDGTLSADGALLGQIGLVRPLDSKDLVRQGGVLFNAESGFEPSDSARMLQGFLEGSNVETITQLARMIEIQRAYEMGQSFLETEDERVRRTMDAMIKQNT